MDHLGGAVLDLDSYYFDRSALPLLVEHLTRLGRGAPVSKPIHAFSAHARVEVETVFPAPVVTVELSFGNKGRQ